MLCSSTDCWCCQNSCSPSTLLFTLTPPVQDPDDEEEYLSHNIFLPDINNEGAYKNKVYKRNMAGLERLVLFRFREDFTVVPRDSAWFSKVQGGRTVPLRDTNLYKVFPSLLVILNECRRDAWYCFRLTISAFPFHELGFPSQTRLQSGLPRGLAAPKHSLAPMTSLMS